MKKITGLSLDKLLEGDPQFRELEERNIEINKRFVSLFPKPTKRGFIFGGYKYPMLTRDQIKETLTKNNLIRKGANPEAATDEAIKREYDVSKHTREKFYSFVELQDGNGQKAYELKALMYDTY